MSEHHIHINYLHIIYSIPNSHGTMNHGLFRRCNFAGSFKSPSAIGPVNRTTPASKSPRSSWTWMHPNRIASISKPKGPKTKLENIYPEKSSHITWDPKIAPQLSDVWKPPATVTRKGLRLHYPDSMANRCYVLKAASCGCVLGFDWLELPQQKKTLTL